jgi:integrase
MFGAMTAAPDGPVAGMGLPAKDLTFGMLAFPQIWDWYLNWRLRRRGFFTTWEVDMLRLGMALCRRQTGWLSQSPDLANHLCSGGPISDDDIERARLDWQATCDQLWDYARSRVKEVARVARVHRDPFEPILPILESSSPVAAYRLITEEIDRRTPDARRYPVAAAEAVRSFLMLRLGLHLGVRQRNLRQLMLCRPGEPQRTERELETLRRGELRWIEHSGQWEVFIPSIAFKNGRSSFFGNRPFRLILPDVAGLYEHLEDYVQSHRDRLLKGRSDPGTLFVKTVKGKTKDASYEGTTFYEAWRLAVQRYGIWNPYTRRGAIAGLLPHGPHSVRDVLATHLLKQTGSYEQASYAIQDTPETVAKHYARFLPQDKAALAADILNRAWS